MATLGDLALRIIKKFPGTDLELVEGWIEQRYRDVLDRVPWPRQETRIVVGLPAEYNTGTIAATNGSNAVTITTGVFTPAMTGRVIRVPVEEVLYVFEYVDATTGLLDRGYEGVTGTGKTFRMNARILDLPANVRMITGVTRSDGQPLASWSKTEMRYRSARGKGVGEPIAYCPAVDGADNLPRIEIYPLPEVYSSLEVEAVLEGSVDATVKSTPLTTWMNPSVIEDGVSANCAASKADWTSADRFEGAYERGVAAAINKAAERMGPVELRGEVRPERVARWADHRRDWGRM